MSAYDEEREIRMKEVSAQYNKIAAEAKAWGEANQDPATGFGMLDDDHDLTFTVDVKWAAEYTEESRWDGPGADKLEELLNEAAKQWARLYAPAGTLTSFVVVEK